MWPVLLHAGPVTLHTYGFFIGLGFLSAYLWLRREFSRSGLPTELAEGLFGVVLISGMAGSRLLFVLLDFPYYARHPLDIFKIWSGGLVFYGGLLLASLFGTLYIRSRGADARTAADGVAPAIALGQAIGRLGCFSAGCCYGAPAQLPWSIRFTHPLSLAPIDTWLHPAQVYEALSDLAIFVGCAHANTRAHSPGRTAALYLGLYGSTRFFWEMFRGDDRGAFLGGLSPSQWISLAALLFAVWLWTPRERR